jgi:AcrR family transcriptional regulator
MRAIPQRMSIRQRLFNTMDKISFSSGLAHVGINQILKESSVAKASLYEHFSSKEALLEEWLNDAQVRWIKEFHSYIDARDCRENPKKEIQLAFDFLEQWTLNPDFNGCPILNTSIEMKSSRQSEASLCAAYLSEFTRFFEERLEKIQVKGKKKKAKVLTSLFIGYIIMCQMNVPAYSRKEHRKTLDALL